jgi:hypothetical protein
MPRTFKGDALTMGWPVVIGQKEIATTVDNN